MDEKEKRDGTSLDAFKNVMDYGLLFVLPSNINGNKENDQETTHDKKPVRCFYRESLQEK